MVILLLMQKDRNKKIVSRFLIPVFAIVVLGFIAVRADTSDSMNLTINVANVAPSVGTPSDGGSSAATPTNVGTNVTFTTTGTDPNGDGYWLAVCKTGGTITPGNAGGAPSCTAGHWCISSSAVASGTQNSCSYTAQQSDPMSNNWIAYVCDNNSVASTCSAGSAGDSPFHVNHPPVIDTVTIGPSYGSSASIDPGNGGTGAVYFRVGVTDPDTEDPADTIDMFACSGNTTSFNPATGTCTGGTLYCSVTGVASGGNADCVASGLAAIPKPHGSYNVKIYLRDSSSTKLQDNGTNNNHSYTITDVPPVISNFNVGNDPLIPAAGGSVNQTFTATITDNNGYADVDSAFGVIYTSPATLTSAGACTTASELNCYNAPVCSLSGGSGTNVTVTCGGAGNLITTWFNITPGSNWKAHVSAVGGTTTYSFNTEGTFTVNPLNAINVAESSVSYGIIPLGGTSDAKTITLQNAGNVITDVLISGTNMTSGGNVISRVQQRWSPSSVFTWGSNDYALLETASVGSAVNGCSDRSIAVTTNHAEYITSTIYWKLKIPDIQPSGNYTGTNYFYATPNNCSGGI